MDAIAFSNGAYYEATTQSACVLIAGNTCTGIDLAGTGSVDETESGQFVTFATPAAAVSVPTLEWNALIAMAVVLCAGGILAVRRTGHTRA